MTLEEVIQLVSNPEKLVDPQQLNILSSYLNGYITDAEEELWEKQLLASHKEVELISAEGLTNAAAKARWRISPEFVEWKQTEMKVHKLKRFRQDLRDRFAILTSIKRVY